MKDSNNFKKKFLKVDKEIELFLKNIFGNKKDNNNWTNIDNDEADASDDVQETKSIINSLSFKNYHFAEVDKQEVWNNILNTQQGLPSDMKAAPMKNGGFLWVKVASVFVLLLSIVAIFFIISYRSGYEVASTNFGETKKIKLPDGSEVVLNANSVLKYRKENPREVWIQGEAFFSVVHTKDDRKFLVKTMDDLSVLVLGTTFNVYNREKKVKVVLNTGKIKLQREGKNLVDMKPGELAEFKNINSYSIKDVDPAIYSSWTNKKLIFKNTSVKELAQLIEDTYGVIVVIPQTQLKEQKISGTILNENLDGLLMAVSETLDLKVLKTSDKITLKSRN